VASNKLTNVNEANFDEQVLKSDLPVLVDFSAVWCGPCRQITPLVEQLASEYEGRVKVMTVDIDESPAIAQRYGIRGVPSLYMFKGGQVVAQQVGSVPKSTIAALIEKAF
jgi:thioredoxin 1